MTSLRQIGLLLAVCLAGEGISALLPFAFPGSVIAMLLLLLLLCTGLLKLRQVESIHAFFMQNMAFFFVPICVNLADSLGLLRSNFVPILVICAISTVLTFAATALTVRGLMHLQRRVARTKAEGTLPCEHS
ncbi:MAG: CidA/LrgA family protein [Pygmaiobacter sp.]